VLFFFVVGCKNQENKEAIQSSGETIRWEEMSHAEIGDFIESIEIIPINWKDNMVSDLLSLNIENGEYFIADKQHNGKIYRIDKNGNIIATFGHFGRGPNEYLEIKELIVDQHVHVFSNLDRAEYIFSKTGEFVERNDIPISFQGIKEIDDGYWLYLGYRDHDINARLIKTDKNWNILDRYLSTAMVITTTEDASVFVPSSKGFLFREMMNNNVYEMANDTLRLAYTLDFGKYNIPEEYYKFSDAHKSADFLFSRDRSEIRRILDNDKYFIAESILANSDRMSGVICYIIKQKSTNKTIQINYSIPAEINNILPNSGGGKWMTEESDLFLLVEPRILYHLKNNTPDFIKLLENPEAIDLLNEGGNQVILRCRLI
jgi:hypothetical protein